MPKQKKSSDSNKINLQELEPVPKKYKIDFSILKGFGSVFAFWGKELATGIKFGFDKTIGVIKSHMFDILGDIKTDLIDPIFGFFKDTWNFLSSIFKRFREEHPDVPILTDILKILKRNEKRQLRENAKAKTGGFLDFIEKWVVPIFIGLGIAAGMLTKKIKLGIDILTSPLKSLRIIGKLFDVVSKPFIRLLEYLSNRLPKIKLPKFDFITKIGELIKGRLSKLLDFKLPKFKLPKFDFITKIGELIKGRLSKLLDFKLPKFKLLKFKLPKFDFITKIGELPIFKLLKGGFLKGFMVGFEKLFWPIQIIMSIFDFVEGFNATKGDTLDKIIGGFKSVFTNLIEIIIGPLRWIANKILGWLGFEEIKMSTGEIIDSIWNVIMDFFGWLKAIWDVVQPIGEYLVNLGIEIIKKVFGLIGELIGFIWDTWKSVVSPIIDKITNLSIFKKITKIFKNIINFFINLPKMILSGVISKLKEFELPWPLNEKKNKALDVISTKLGLDTKEISNTTTETKTTTIKQQSELNKNIQEANKSINNNAKTIASAVDNRTTVVTVPQPQPKIPTNEDISIMFGSHMFAGTD